jgi:hypothetical protein
VILFDQILVVNYYCWALIDLENQTRL